MRREGCAHVGDPMIIIITGSSSSRASCYLPADDLCAYSLNFHLRKISDDDRLSLTTALSEEEDGEARNSPYRARSGSAAASFNCTGAVRKAGFLSVKKWLLRKKQQVELARKRGWKGYWVCLKGTTLLFYPCDNRDNRAIDTAPKHLIIVDGPMPC
ncbi:unnamed protein product [Larinioides sclopetarius]|uniref:PH domain-containing protein n=1 Tax=Larinioides sclopetarius TaxID=280406 RepID=A0AAV1YWR6_9ARAC